MKVKFTDVNVQDDKMIMHTICGLCVAFDNFTELRRLLRDFAYSVL